MEALETPDGLGAVDLEAAVDFVVRCQTDDGGFRNKPDGGRYISNMEYALRLLRVAGALDRIDREAAIEWVLSLRSDGGFNPTRHV